MGQQTLKNASKTYSRQDNQINQNQSLLTTSTNIVYSFPNLVKPISHTIIGQKTVSRSAHDLRLRRKKTFVQKVFLELIHKFSDEKIQKISYFNLYQELCIELTPTSQGGAMRPRLLMRPASPYFSTGQKNATIPVKMRHASIKERFLKMASKKKIAICCTDRFQLACTLQNLWEHAVHMTEQQYNAGTHLYNKAEQLLNLAKELPGAFYPLEENKSFIHISSFTNPFKSASEKLKAPQKAAIEAFIEAVVAFGDEYYGIAEAAN